MPSICPQCGSPFESSSDDFAARCLQCGFVQGESDSTIIADLVAGAETVSVPTNGPEMGATNEMELIRIPPPEQVGRYQIRKPLGQGSFGTVYMAFDPELQRLVAIKMPRHGRRFTAGEADAFVAEARMLARLDHPNIVPVHDVGRDELGQCYMVSKYIQGRDLADLIASGTEAESLIHIIVMVADALDYMHQTGVIHRDIKPSNLILDHANRVWVTDFGLARSSIYPYDRIEGRKTTGRFITRMCMFFSVEFSLEFLSSGGNETVLSCFDS